MPLSLITGLETDLNWTTKRNFTNLSFKKLTYVGLREANKVDKDLIKTSGIRQLAVEQILGAMREMEGPIHISFDVKALDPFYVSSTATPISNGLDPHEVEAIFEEALDLDKLVSCDVVEFNGNFGD